jgi:hypothetical protein
MKVTHPVGEETSKREYERLCQELFEMRKKKAILFSGWSLFISLVAALGVCVAIWYANTLGIPSFSS